MKQRIIMWEPALFASAAVDSHAATWQWLTPGAPLSVYPADTRKPRTTGCVYVRVDDAIEDLTALMRRDNEAGFWRIVGYSGLARKRGTPVKRKVVHATDGAALFRAFMLLERGAVESWRHGLHGYQFQVLYERGLVVETYVVTPISRRTYERHVPA